MIALSRWKLLPSDDFSTNNKLKYFFNYPLNAATLSGMLRVWSGSMIPSSGLRALLAIPVLASAGRWSNTATPVVSLPVPEVVGTETNFR